MISNSTNAQEQAEAQTVSGSAKVVLVPKTQAAKQRSSLELTLLALWQDRAAVAALATIFLAVVISIAAPVIAPYDPYEQTGELREPLGSRGHMLGTDRLGRDVLSRLMWGGRVSIPIAIAPVVVAAVFATIIGIGGGYLKTLGEIAMRITDVFFAVPFVLSAMAVVAILGPGMMNVMLSISIFLIPWMSRIIYTEVVAIRESDFIEAARVCGSSSWQIMTEEILPNAISPILVACTVQAGSMIVVAAGLSFLGLGVAPPTADWGIMVAEGQPVLRVAPHLSGVPGALILVLSLAFNLLGDGLRDALDPRLRASKSLV